MKLYKKGIFSKCVCDIDVRGIPFSCFSETSNSKSAADESPPAEHLESGDMAELSAQDDGEVC